MNISSLSKFTSWNWGWATLMAVTVKTTYLLLMHLFMREMLVTLKTKLYRKTVFSRLHLRVKHSYKYDSFYYLLVC